MPVLFVFEVELSRLGSLAGVRGYVEKGTLQSDRVHQSLPFQADGGGIEHLAVPDGHLNST